MNFPATIASLAAVGNAGLAVLAAARRPSTTSTWLLTLLGTSLAVWNFGDAFAEMTAERQWRIAALVAAPLSPALAWHFVHAFLGRQHEVRRMTAGLYAVAGALALITAAGLVVDEARAFVETPYWNVAVLLGIFPFAGVAIWRCAAAARETTDPLFRNRIRYVLLAVLIGIASGFSDLVAALGVPVRGVGHLGSLVCVAIMVFAALRHQMLDIDQALRRIRDIVVVTSLAVAAYVGIVVWWGPEWDVLLFLVVIITLLLLLAARTIFETWTAEAARLHRLALMGQLAAGVAHEVRNPLTAIRGAAQVLERATEGPNATAETREYFALLKQEVDRLDRLVEDFQALGRPPQPRQERVLLAPFLESTVTALESIRPVTVEVTREVPPEAAVRADPNLLRQVLANLVRNAYEAMPEGGRLTLRLLPSAEGKVSLEVGDTGPGIKHEARAHLFEPFQTTKARGTGLGLALARRLVESQDGTLDLANDLGPGARFVLRLRAAAVE